MLYEMTLHVHIIKHSGVWFWTNGVAAIKKRKKKKRTSGHRAWAGGVRVGEQEGGC